MAVSAVFAANGFLFASWVSRIPAVSDRLAASPAELGTALLFVAVGSIVTMPFVGGLCSRWGSRPVTWATLLLTSAALVLLPLAPTLPVLAVALALFGASFGAMDVAMNVQANGVVRLLRRPVMPAFHGAFSLGLLAGALLGGALAGLGLPVVAHLVAAALLGAGVGLAARPALLPPAADGGDPADSGDREGAPRRSSRRWSALLVAALPVGVLALATAVAEGAMADWGALFLRDVRGTSEAVAPLGYAAFAVLMAAGRLGGERLITRLGPVAVLQRGGLLAIAGVLLAVLVPSWVAGVAGFALVGAGLACAFPLAMSSAGERGGPESHSAVALVATVGYTGFLLGPPMIGFLAEAVGLRLALLAVAAVLVVVPLTARAVTGPRTARGQPAPVTH